MSDHTDIVHARRGSALLLAVVICAVVGVTVLALWRGTTTTARAISTEFASAHVDAVADSARVRAIAAADSAHWRRLVNPGDWFRVASFTSRTTAWRAEIARLTWRTLLVRGSAERAGGARGVRARSDHRTLIPLITPFDFPDAALTGDQPWTVDSTAMIAIAAPSGREQRCRWRTSARPTALGTLPTLIDSIRLPVIDPDTLTDSIVGAFRLDAGRLRTPLRVRGMVVVDTVLTVEADLHLTGVLVVRGSVHPAGGHLDITGAVRTGDAFGGASTLGPADRVRYDGCTIRSAMDLVTSRGPTATWTALDVF